MNRSSPSPDSPPRIALGTGWPGLPDGPRPVVVALDPRPTGPALDDCIDDLRRLIDDVALTRRFAGQLMIAFEGIERDPRQVHVIPACRDWLQALHRRWPYWLHFLAPVPDQWAMWLLAVLPPQTPVTLPNGRRGRRIDRVALDELLLILISAMQELHHHHQIPPEERQRITDAAFDAIERATGVRPTLPPPRRRRSPTAPGLDPDEPDTGGALGDPPPSRV
jgi:hypothetical protein